VGRTPQLALKGSSWSEAVTLHGAGPAWAGVR